MKQMNLGEIIVKDNFLPPSLLSSVKSCVLSPEINWNYHLQATHGLNEDLIDQHDDYFVHKAFWIYNNQKFTSPEYNIISPILFFIEDKINYRIERIFRINVTFITKKQKQLVTPFHVDIAEPHHVGILYLNTCDGPTLIHERQIDSIENRFVLFDGRYSHAAVQQTNTNCRINIVFNFLGKFY